MKYKKCFLYLVTFLIIIFLIIIFLINKDKIKRKNNYNNNSSNKETELVSTEDWVLYTNGNGFSFRYSPKFEIKEAEDSIEIGGILVKLDKFNCNNLAPLDKIKSQTTIYGYKADIDEAFNTATICNNKNTACLEIEPSSVQDEKKITEGFFHSFLSTLNMNSDFDKIDCLE